VQCSEQEVCDLLAALNVTKASDQDGISARMLRYTTLQKFACKLASHQWDSSYLDLLQLYQLPSLEERKLHLKLGLMFKIIHNLCYYPDIPCFRDNIHRRAAHAIQFKAPFAHTNVYYFAYSPHTMSVWNSLDSECVTSSTYSSFTNHLRS